MHGNDGKAAFTHDVSDAEAQRLDRPALAEKLVAQGASRLTAERLAAILKGEAEVGRARRRAQARH
jgi:hypothetical protein